MMNDRETAPKTPQNESEAFFSWIDSAAERCPRMLVGMPARLAWLAALEYAKTAAVGAGGIQDAHAAAPHADLHWAVVKGFMASCATPDQTAENPAGARASAQNDPRTASPWARSADTPPPVGVPVALYTPGFGLEEFVNDGPEAYPDRSQAQSWWVALPLAAKESDK